MQTIKTDIDGVVIIEPRIFNDGRGYFFESYSERDFRTNVREVKLVQHNESWSSYRLDRGMPFQKPPFTLSKLVTVIQVALSDVHVCLL